MLTLTGKPLVTSRRGELGSGQGTSDEALIVAVAAGDRRAMRVLYARHNVRRSDEQLDDEVATAIADPADDAETMVNERDRSTIVGQCLSQLSPLHREVLDLAYYHEKSVDEVVQIVGAPANTVKSRMFYARKRMETLLKAAGLGQ